MSAFLSNRGIFTTNAIRRAQMAGREYLVVPMVMITEGIHNGSAGPHFYPESELSRNPGIWNHKPVVVYHPEFRGQAISACDPSVITSQSVGVIMNTHWDGVSKKLKAEAWLEYDRLLQVDQRVLNAINNNQMMEVSTGLNADAFKEPGQFRNQTYEYVVRNIQADHLAILPDEIGACSIKDGAGLLRTNSGKKRTYRRIQNNLSSSYIWEALNDQLERHFPGELDVYVWELFPEERFFILYRGDRLFRLSYSVQDMRVMVSNDPVEVLEVREYRTLDGSFVGNS